MLPYRSKIDTPSHAARLRAGSRVLLTPLFWLFIGTVILFVLLLLWLLPISPALNPLVWIGRLLGISGPANVLYYGPSFGAIANIGSILPATLGLLSMIALSASLKVYRRRRAVAVLGHVASAVHLRVPLPPYLRAAAVGERWALRRRLLRMADQLAGGRAIGSALTEAAGELPPLTIDRIAAAERSFALDGALAPLLRRERDRLAVTSHASATRPYFILLVITLLTVVFMVMVFVIPKFAQIFNDFKVKLPWATQLLIDISHWIFTFGFLGSDFVGVAISLLMVPAFFVVLCSILARATRGLFTSRPGRRLTGPVTDRVVWYTPFFGRMARDRHAAAACEALSEALLVGRPLPDAIYLATLPSLNVVLRRRMRQWQEAVEAGASAAAGARAAKLPALLCDMLAGAQSDPAAAVAFAGRAYAAAWHRRTLLLDSVLPVVFTLVMAVLVGFVAIALLTPIVSLVSAMSPGGVR